MGHACLGIGKRLSVLVSSILARRSSLKKYADDNVVSIRDLPSIQSRETEKVTRERIQSLLSGPNARTEA